MRQFAIQLLLIVGVLAVAWRLLGSYGQRAQALRRIGLLAFAAFAVWSILDPAILNGLARLLGIGRGADLVLYGLVVAFFGFVVTTFRRFREMEVRYTRLARRIALDEAPPVVAHREPPPAAPVVPGPSPAPTDPLPTVAAAGDAGGAPERDRSGTDPTGTDAHDPDSTGTDAPGDPMHGMRDVSAAPDVTSATPLGGGNGVLTGSPETLAGSPNATSSLKAADAD